MISKYLIDRQLSSNKLLNSDYFSNKIIKSYYQKSDQFYTFTKDYSNQIELGINVLDFSKCGSFMAIGSDCNLLLWKIDNFETYSQFQKIETNDVCVKHLALSFDSTQIIYWGWIEDMYENQNLIINDVETGKIIKEIKNEEFVYHIDMNSLNIVKFITQKNLMSYDLRTIGLSKIKIKSFNQKELYSLHHHPIDNNLLLISSSSNLFTLDLRNNELVKKYYLSNHYKYSSCRAMYNKSGTKILVERSYSLPTLFDVKQDFPEFEFDHHGLNNLFSASHCCFAGPKDEYVVSTSDSFNIFIWEIPEIKNDNLRTTKINSANFVLFSYYNYGVKYNYQKSMLASYGLSNKISFFSPFSLSGSFSKTNSSDSELTNNSFKMSYQLASFFLRCKLEKKKFVFDSHLNNVLNKKTLNMQSEFNENSNIRYIKTLIINYITTDKKTYLNLLNCFKLITIQTDLAQNKDKKLISLLMEIIKIFRNKHFIINSIYNLKFYTNLSKKTKRKLVYLNEKKPSVKKSERLESLKRMRLMMKSMIYDLIVIIKTNKELYEMSFQILEEFTRIFDRTYELPILRKILLEESNFFENEITSDSNFDFCFKIEDNKKLSLSNYYSKNNLKKLEYNLDFKKKIKMFMKNIK